MRARITTTVVLCAPVKHYLTRALRLAGVGLRAWRAISDGCSNQHRSLLLVAGSRCRRQSGGHALRASEAAETTAGLLWPSAFSASLGAPTRNRCSQPVRGALRVTLAGPRETRGAPPDDPTASPPCDGRLLPPPRHHFRRGMRMHGST